MNNQNNLQVKEKYQQKADYYTSLARRLRNRLMINSLVRLVIFTSIIITVIFYFKLHFLPLVFLIIVLIVIFAVLLRRHQSLKISIAVTQQLCELNKKELLALQYDFSMLKDNGSEVLDPSHDFLTDLDIFGEGSLFQMINRICSVDGREQLIQILKNNSFDPNHIKNKQNALLELESMLDWRQLFYANGTIIEPGLTDRDNFFSWLNEPIIYSKNKLFRLLSIFIPIVVVTSFLLLIFNLLSFALFAFIFTIPLTIIGLDLKRINRIHGSIGKRSEFLKIYGILVKMIEDQNFKSQLLVDIQNKFFSNNLAASRSIKNLSSLVNAFDSRLNIVVGVLLNGFFMWDYQCLFRLERWKLRNTAFIEAWFYAIGEIDALNSLANFNYNNPHFCVPHINTAGHFTFECQNLGHPLLSPAERVNNNFSLTNLKTFIIITGANMSGKSTFLRTLGINMVLASAGARVCSSVFVYSPISVYTSMRTTDSLYKHESYFYAELKRLQSLLERLKSGEQIFILLDEILKGTNSVDKLQGSIAFLKQLLKLECAGVIATHDLSLTDMENDFPDQIQNMCFEIEIKNSEIFFDYKLLNGVTKKMNAQLLMKQMGLI